MRIDGRHVASVSVSQLLVSAFATREDGRFCCCSCGISFQEGKRRLLRKYREFKVQQADYPSTDASFGDMILLLYMLSAVLLSVALKYYPSSKISNIHGIHYCLLL